jgi:acyl-CoA synthetase (AMP-forming)/AMP-acid ligase II
MLSLIPTTTSVTDAMSGTTLSCPAFRAVVAARAENLRDIGAARGDRIAIAEPSGLAYLVNILACWQIGACAVALTPALTANERERVAESVGPRAWSGPSAPGGVPQMPTCDVRTHGTGTSPPVTPEPADLDAPALILMTSGTTATPKGVVHSLRSLQARVALNIAYIGHDDLARSLTLLPMHFGHGLIGNTLTPLLAGADLIVHPEPGIDGIARLGALIDAERITFMSSTPALWRVAIKIAKPPTGGTLRRIHVGSAPLSRDLWSAIAAWTGTRSIVNMYGVTETANWISGQDLADLPDITDPTGQNVNDHEGLVGRPWGTSARVRRDDGSLADFGRGEIMVATPGLMQGYFGQPDLTARVLNGGWFATGDIGEIDSHGRIRIVGRLKHEINRAGVKIPAEEIDLLLERHPQVREACAFALPDAVVGELVAVAIVAADGEPIDTDALKAWCSQHIRREAVPAKIFVLDELPRTDRGKLNRDRVRAACLQTGTSGHV